jgi:hypothetical protein
LQTPEDAAAEPGLVAGARWILAIDLGITLA